MSSLLWNLLVVSDRAIEMITNFSFERFIRNFVAREVGQIRRTSAQ